MSQAIDERDIQPLPNPLSDAFGGVDYILEAVVRSLKRLFREKVTPNDYSQIWAEIRDDGSIVRGSKSDTPELILCANRVPNSDDWIVQKQRRGAIITVQNYTTGQNDISIPSYEIVEDFGLLSEDEVYFLMSVADPEPRSSWLHYSRAFGMR